jgi:hypothetical protein
MLRVVWNRVKFRVIDVPRKGVKFCSIYDLSHIIDPLLTALQADERHPLSKPVINADNASVHASGMMDVYFESHQFQQADHPTHPPDLAPLVFLLFGLIKGQSKGTHFLDGQVLICEVRRIPPELPPKMLPSTFDA